MDFGERFDIVVQISGTPNPQWGGHHFAAMIAAGAGAAEDFYDSGIRRQKLDADGITAALVKRNTGIARLMFHDANPEIFPVEPFLKNAEAAGFALKVTASDPETSKVRWTHIVIPGAMPDGDDFNATWEGERGNGPMISAGYLGHLLRKGPAFVSAWCDMAWRCNSGVSAFPPLDLPAEMLNAVRLPAPAIAE